MEPNRLICLKTNYINIGRFAEKSSRGAKTSVLILIKGISGRFGHLVYKTQDQRHKTKDQKKFVFRVWRLVSNLLVRQSKKGLAGGRVKKAVDALRKE